MKRLLGGILVAAGILIGGASGLCSGVFLLLSLANWSAGSAQILWLVFVIGGPPMLIGFGLYKLGRYLIRQAETAGNDEVD